LLAFAVTIVEKLMVFFNNASQSWKEFFLIGTKTEISNLRNANPKRTRGVAKTEQERK
jgi:hypothetical protein